MLYLPLDLTSHLTVEFATSRERTYSPSFTPLVFLRPPIDASRGTAFCLLTMILLVTSNQLEFIYIWHYSYIIRLDIWCRSRKESSMCEYKLYN